MKPELVPTPEQALQARVAAAHARGDRITAISDSDSYSEVVLVGIAIGDAAAFVMTIDRAEYDGFKVLKAMGVPCDGPAPTANAIDRAKRAQKKGTKA
ncbi:MAG TPA: hypothetical protein VF453_06680 [Burkholderiaceae bacterium]